MMTFIWILLGIGMIYALARYNESNGLFWKLLISFLVGFAACDIIMHNVHKNQNEDQLTQVCPTQVSMGASGCTINLLADVSPSMSVNVSSNPVSQVYTPAEREYDASLSKVFGNIRGQPHSAMFYDDT